MTLAPTVPSLGLTGTSAPSQSSLAGIATSILLPLGIRSPASITLHAIGDQWYARSSVDLAHYGLDIAGTIDTDPKSSVTLTGDQIAVVGGTVSAPGGTITFSGGTYSGVATTQGPAALNGEGVWLVSGGQLLATGTAVAIPSGGFVSRDVLPGGQVTISGGDIILAPGSVIDVSGTSGLSSFAAAGSGPPAGSSVFVLPDQTYAAFSAGGTISISAQVGAVLEGALSGASGGSNAAGGTLSLTLAAHGGNPSNGGQTGGIWPAIENTYIVVQSTLGTRRQWLRRRCITNPR